MSRPDNLNRHLLIRTDSDPSVGMGHVMRCLALAQAWRLDNGPVTFAGNFTSPVLRENLIREGVNLVEIPPDADVSEDVKFVVSAARERNVTWVVLDGYRFSSEYQKKVRLAGVKLLVLDDYAHLPLYDADILLNQNINTQNCFYDIPDNTLLLAGSRYSLLRSEFLEQERSEEKSHKEVSRILVTLGGADLGNVTLQIIEALQSIPGRMIAADVVVGGANPNYVELQNVACQINRKTAGKIVLHLNPCMPKLMYSADMAVSAGGSTCWELCYMGVPFVVGCLAENQRDICGGLEEAGIAINCGWFDHQNKRDLVNCISALVNNRILRQQFSDMGSKCIDGRGSQRVIKAMQGVE